MPKFEVEVIIEVEATDADEAFQKTDSTLQRLWDRDHAGSKPGVAWHFTMLEGCVADVTEEVQRDAATEEDLRLIRKYDGG